MMTAHPFVTPGRTVWYYRCCDCWHVWTATDRRCAWPVAAVSSAAQDLAPVRYRTELPGPPWVHGDGKFRPLLL